MKKHYKIAIIAVVIILVMMAIYTIGKQIWIAGTNVEDGTQAALETMRYIEPSTVRDDPAEQALPDAGDAQPTGTNTDAGDTYETSHQGTIAYATARATEANGETNVYEHSGEVTLPVEHVTVEGIDDTLMEKINGDVEGLEETVTLCCQTSRRFGNSDILKVVAYEVEKWPTKAEITLMADGYPYKMHIRYRYETKQFEFIAIDTH